MNKIALTGANGFVGSNLACKLKKNNFQVKCLVRANSDLSLLPENVEICKVDYNDSEQVAAFLQDCDFLIHNAALTRAKTWKEFKKINVDFTENLLKLAAEETKIKRFIFISSQAAAGPASNYDKPKQEKDKCKPVSWYGKSKLLAEKIIQDYSFPYTIIRPVSVFGPGDKDFLIYFKLISHNLAFQVGFKPKFMSLVFVDDLVEMISRSLNEKAENEILFSASTPKISMQEFIEILSKIMHKKTMNLHIPHFLVDLLTVLFEPVNFLRKRPPVLNRQKAREFKQKYWLADPQKTWELLNFKTELSLAEQLKITYNWYKNKGWL